MARKFTGADGATHVWEPGSKLPNSATVVDTAGDGRDAYVLAVWRGEYVTWALDPESGRTFWGNYFRALAPAIADLSERASR